MLGAEGARQINEAIKDALDMDGKEASTTPNVVRVDLAQVSGMGSAAIGAFIVLHKSLDAKACRLELDNPNKSIREALEFLKLDRVLTITSRQ